MKQNDILKRRIPFVAEYNNLGEQYIVSAKVHMDESTPHMHIVFIPVIHKLDKKSGKEINKIACSEYWKGKDSYKKLQDKFYEHMIKNGFDLKRGKETGIEHLSTEKLKQITEYNRIKEETNNQSIEKLEDKNTELILSQNKQLIKYNRKLKMYLIKSLKVVEQVETLKCKNYNLTLENDKIKKENQRLVSYIENTYEVIKYLFNFPISSLKNIVQKYIIDMNKR